MTLFTVALLPSDMLGGTIAEISGGAIEGVRRPLFQGLNTYHPMPAAPPRFLSRIINDCTSKNLKNWAFSRPLHCCVRGGGMYDLVRNLGYFRTQAPETPPEGRKTTEALHTAPTMELLDTYAILVARHSPRVHLPNDLLARMVGCGVMGGVRVRACMSLSDECGCESAAYNRVNSAADCTTLW